MELNEASRIIQELKSLIRKLGNSEDEGIIKELNNVSLSLEEKFSTQQTIIYLYNDGP